MRWWVLAVGLALMAGACTDPAPTSSDDDSRAVQGDPSSTTSVTADPPSEPAERSASFENGLEVEVTPVAGGSSVAVVLVYAVGARHDPTGRSGLAHFVEHLLATAATRVEEVRTVDEFIAAYPLGWNAQTGADFTVVATVVDPDALEAELALTAARLEGIRPTEDDLSRERPRILQEVENMFGGIPALAAANNAREQLLATPNGGRRGGLPGVLASVTLEEITRRLALYNPSNATLSIAGDVDVDATLDLVAEYFADIPAGPTPPPPTPYVAGAGGLITVAATAPEGVVAAAYAAPPPTSDLYPAFLIAIGRLFVAGQSVHITTSYAVIDDPDVVVFTSPIRPGEDGPAAFQRLRSGLAGLLTAPLVHGEVAQTSAIFGPLLGWSPSGNSYGVALSAALRPRLAINPQQIASALPDVDGPSYLDAVDRLFTAAPAAGAATEP